MSVMPQLLLTPGETLLMRAALKRRLIELGKPGNLPTTEIAEVESITRLLRQLAMHPSNNTLPLNASTDETVLIARTLNRQAAWQRSVLPQAREQGVLATLRSKVEALVTPSSLQQRVSRRLTGLWRHDAV